MFGARAIPSPRRPRCVRRARAPPEAELLALYRLLLAHGPLDVRRYAGANAAQSAVGALWMDVGTLARRIASGAAARADEYLANHAHGLGNAAARVRFQACYFRRDMARVADGGSDAFTHTDETSHTSSGPASPGARGRAERHRRDRRRARERRWPRRPRRRRRRGGREWWRRSGGRRAARDLARPGRPPRAAPLRLLRQRPRQRRRPQGAPGRSLAHSLARFAELSPRAREDYETRPPAFFGWRPMSSSPPHPPARTVNSGGGGCALSKKTKKTKRRRRRKKKKTPHSR